MLGSMAVTSESSTSDREVLFIVYSFEELAPHNFRAASSKLLAWPGTPFLEPPSALVRAHGAVVATDRGAHCTESRIFLHEASATRLVLSTGRRAILLAWPACSTSTVLSYAICTPILIALQLTGTPVGTGSASVVAHCHASVA